MFLARRCPLGSNSAAVRLASRSHRHPEVVSPASSSLSSAAVTRLVDVSSSAPLSTFSSNSSLSQRCGSEKISSSHRYRFHPANNNNDDNHVVASMTHLMSSLRPFSTTGSNDGQDQKSNDKESEQNFFLNDEESLPKPPSYIRDATTGKWTGETHAELTSKDRKLLNMDDDSKSDEVMSRLEERWQSAAKDAESGDDTADDGFGTLNGEHERVARRIREQQMALGPIGRDPALASSKNEGGDDIETPLTPREFRALRGYAKSEHNIHPNEFTKMNESDPDLLPHNNISSGSDGSTPSNQFFDADLDLAYLNPKLNKEAFSDTDSAYDGINDDPFADLLPSDLNPARMVNRRHAKLLPSRLLHHNNLMLLRRYITPGGKIMNRVQSRLGAKDQRKVAKLIKRARHLGLIPHMGQWKLEDHGYLHEKGLKEADAKGGVGEEVEGKRDWEVELEKRGLWPLADDKELAMRWMNMDKMLDHIAGPMGEKSREELEDLLSAGTLEGGEKAKMKQEEGK